MNGPHDMGGAQNFGPVVPERNEPRFHQAWERRAFALTLAMGGARRWNLDQSRSARESLPPAQYLASSYYQIWLEGLIVLMLERGLVTREELDDGRMREPPARPFSALTAAEVASALAGGASTARQAASPARFRVGDSVRTLVMNPPTHTRLPRYCRDKRGTTAAVHGAHVFPDANARGSEDPQWLYTVRFDGADLWGTDTSASSVYVDCWEPYLEPA
jgi:nitrile hydratase